MGVSVAVVHTDSGVAAADVDDNDEKLLAVLKKSNKQER